MGRQTKLKKVAKESQLFLSANASGIPGVSANEAPCGSGEPLEVSLFHLKLDVLARVKKDDGVSVDVRSSPFKVVVKGGKVVGEIPSRYEDRVVRACLLSGSVLNVRLSPPGLRIVLKSTL